MTGLNSRPSSKQVDTQMPTTHETPPAPHIDSPFHRLPAEIRNMIYALALGNHTWTISMSDANKPRADNGFRNALALLQVNRQISAEARFFPYLHSTFEGRHIGHLREWIQLLTTEQRTSITAIRFHMRGYIVPVGGGLDANPTFWMDVPRMAKYNLEALKRIEIDLALRKWSSSSDETESVTKQLEIMEHLREILMDEHPGVMIDLVLRRDS